MDTCKKMAQHRPEAMCSCFWRREMKALQDGNMQLLGI